MSNELIPHTNLEGTLAWCHVILGVWVAYRVIRGWLALAGQRPIGTS